MNVDARATVPEQLVEERSADHRRRVAPCDLRFEAEERRRLDRSVRISEVHALRGEFVIVRPEQTPSRPGWRLLMSSRGSDPPADRDVARSARDGVVRRELLVPEQRLAEDALLFRDGILGRHRAVDRVTEQTRDGGAETRTDGGERQRRAAWRASWYNASRPQRYPVEAVPGAANRHASRRARRSLKMSPRNGPLIWSLSGKKALGGPGQAVVIKERPVGCGGLELVDALRARLVRSRGAFGRCF